MGSTEQGDTRAETTSNVRARLDKQRRAGSGQPAGSGAGRGMAWARRRSPDHGRVIARDKRGKDRGSARRRGAETDCGWPDALACPTRQHGQALARGGDRAHGANSSDKVTCTNFKAPENHYPS
jgi:hypothetical protein